MPVRQADTLKDVKDDAQEDGWDIPHDQEFKLETAGQNYDAMVKIRGGLITEEKNPKLFFVFFCLLYLMIIYITHQSALLKFTPEPALRALKRR